MGTIQFVMSICINLYLTVELIFLLGITLCLIDKRIAELFSDGPAKTQNRTPRTESINATQMLCALFSMS